MRDKVVDLSLIVPTFNERENIEKVMRGILNVFENTKIKWQLIIVDDDSSDGTFLAAENLKNDLGADNIFPFKRKYQKGLSSAVLFGFNFAQGKLLGVLDADLSHDLNLIPKMIYAIEEKGFDVAIGSRYVTGAKMDWSFKRHVFSLIATKLALGLTSVRDPLSGFFLIKKEILKNIRLNAYGFKILLEILCKIKSNCAIKEIPYTFRDRTQGESKLSLDVILGYMTQLIELYSYKIFHKKNK